MRGRRVVEKAREGFLAQLEPKQLVTLITAVAMVAGGWLTNRAEMDRRANAAADSLRASNSRIAASVDSLRVSDRKQWRYLRSIRRRAGGSLVAVGDSAFYGAAPPMKQPNLAVRFLRGVLPRFLTGG